MAAADESRPGALEGARPSERHRRWVGGTLATLAVVAFFWGSRSTRRGYREDTISVALKAVRILRQGTDEYGERLPLVGFRSFGDYKGVLNLYGVAAVFALTGASLYAARLLSMSLTCLATLALVLGLRRAPEVPGQSGAVTDGTFLALLLLSPWLLRRRVP